MIGRRADYAPPIARRPKAALYRYQYRAGASSSSWAVPEEGFAITGGSVVDTFTATNPCRRVVQNAKRTDFPPALEPGDYREVVLTKLADSLFLRRPRWEGSGFRRRALAPYDRRVWARPGLSRVTVRRAATAEPENTVGRAWQPWGSGRGPGCGGTARTRALTAAPVLGPPAGGGLGRQPAHWSALTLAPPSSWPVARGSLKRPERLFAPVTPSAGTSAARGRSRASNVAASWPCSSIWKRCRSAGSAGCSSKGFR